MLPTQLVAFVLYCDDMVLFVSFEYFSFSSKVCLKKQNQSLCLASSRQGVLVSGLNVVHSRLNILCPVVFYSVLKRGSKRGCDT